MIERRSVNIGTRGSDLALWQARHVAGMVQSRLGLGGEIVIVKTKGDRIRDVAFHKMEGKGFFTKELQDALLNHRVDLVVHSLKDLPVEEPSGLALAAVPERAKPTDLLLARRGLLDPAPADPLGLPEGAVLGTSSLRRAAQALSLRPDLAVEPLRGNVPTRVRKLQDGAYDAIIVATAGVERLELDLEGLERHELPLEAMLPAPGQGALAIECRADDDLRNTIAVLDDADVSGCVTAERALLERLGGGCHLPLGCLASAEDGAIRLQAALGDIDSHVSQAGVSRVAAVAPDPETVSQACYEALRLAMPEVVT